MLWTMATEALAIAPSPPLASFRLTEEPWPPPEDAAISCRRSAPHSAHMSFIKVGWVQRVDRVSSTVLRKKIY